MKRRFMLLHPLTAGCGTFRPSRMFILTSVVGGKAELLQTGLADDPTSTLVVLSGHPLLA
jgi:hypothetical protein